MPKKVVVLFKSTAWSRSPIEFKELADAIDKDDNAVIVVW